MMMAIQRRRVALVAVAVETSVVSVIVTFLYRCSGCCSLPSSVARCRTARRPRRSPPCIRSIAEAHRAIASARRPRRVRAPPARWPQARLAAAGAAASAACAKGEPSRACNGRFGTSSSWPHSSRLRLRQRGSRLEPAAQRADQVDGHGELARVELCIEALLREHRLLRRQHLKVVAETFAVAHQRKRIGLLRRLERTALLDALRVEQRSALETAQQAYTLSLMRYREGLGNYLQVLSAEQPMLAQQSLDAELDARELAVSINLIRALGGGFEPAAALAQAQSR